jgi:hypothetical protein
MYIDYSSWETFEYKLSTLQLDLNNPRIKYRGVTLNQTQILKFLIKNEKVYELAKKISEEGYFVGEEPIICIEKNKKVVLEGNRRTAALKLLQDPKKYLSTAKANVLIKNVLENNFPVERKLKCYIAPNRLLANPIIYERHNGASLKKWKTGNQYAFVAEMYYEEGLSIEDICHVLNEKRSSVLRPLKAYNLFFEGKEVLEKEKNIFIDISDFDITNLERFYDYEEGRRLIGIDFNNDTGELIIYLPREEFEKRILVVFEMLLDADRFSRDFNNEQDKKRVISNLKTNKGFDFTVEYGEGKTNSRTSEQKKDLEAEKQKKTTRRKKRSKRGQYQNYVIPRDKEIIFDNEKLDILFTELKWLPIDKVNAFAVLFRSYLEQSLYFYISQNDLLEDMGAKVVKDSKENGQKKVDNLIRHLKGKYSISKEIDSAPIMSILKFNTSKDYSNTTLKIMLDYVIKKELINHVNTNEYKNIKDYIERIKSGLDLAVHSLNTFVDLGHNKRAWQHLEPLFDMLANNLNKE